METGDSDSLRSLVYRFDRKSGIIRAVPSHHTNEVVMRRTLIAVVVTLRRCSAPVRRTRSEIRPITASCRIRRRRATGASVTVTNTQTACQHRAAANNAGVYVFPNLLQASTTSSRVGRIRGEIRNRVELQIQQTIRMDFRLQRGTLSETVEAVATARCSTPKM